MTCWLAVSPSGYRVRMPAAKNDDCWLVCWVFCAWLVLVLLQPLQLRPKCCFLDVFKKFLKSLNAVVVTIPVFVVVAVLAYFCYIDRTNQAQDYSRESNLEIAY